MKLCTSSKVLAVCLMFLAAPSLIFAAGATVDCTGATPGAFTSINAAIQSLPPVGPNSINVLSNCTENVIVNGYSNLTISAVPGSFSVSATDANHRAMVIFDSLNVFVDGLSFSGGRGIFINNSRGVQIGDGTISNSSLQGIIALGSVVDIFNLTIQNSTRSGISAADGVFNVDGGVTITGSGRSGIVMTNGHLTLNGGDGVTPGTENVISNNTGTGVAVVDSAEADISADNRITGNQGAFGLEVIHTSTVIWSGGGTISGNKIGVHIGETSHGEFDTVNITGNNGNGIEVTDHSDGYIDGGVNSSGNTGAGIQVMLSSVLNSLGGDTINNNADDGIQVDLLSIVKFAANDTITGNQEFALHCGNGSLVVGDVAAYKPKKCGIAFQATPID
ncbi:MAG TPA: right-handed parallel beta-helix repeat-containing protein [Candidatus Angelobacter sp.]|nr:right-handed parallel beta-helix repeat-containing protein [Candidatus Angelobacter sp.]